MDHRMNENDIFIWLKQNRTNLIKLILSTLYVTRVSREKYTTSLIITYTHERYWHSESIKWQVFFTYGEYSLIMYHKYIDIAFILWQVWF